MSVCPSVYLVTSLKSPRTMIQSRVLQSVSSPAPARQSVCPARSCVTRDTKQGGGCVTIFRHLNINSFPFRCWDPVPYRNKSAVNYTRSVDGIEEAWPQLLLQVTSSTWTVLYLVWLNAIGGSGSVVGIATAYGQDGPGIQSRWGEIFRKSPDQPWGPPSLLYNGYRVFPGGKVLPGRDADPSPPSSAEV